MSLSDCPKCWDTPCGCGHMYESWSVVELRGHAKMLNEIADRKAPCKANEVILVGWRGGRRKFTVAHNEPWVLLYRDTPVGGMVKARGIELRVTHRVENVKQDKLALFVEAVE